MATIPTGVIGAAQAAQKARAIPASVSIAQWALESAWGAHAPGFNCFGVKALPGHAVQTFTTHEVVHGHSVQCQQNFAAFATLAEAFDCHAKLLATSAYYKDAMAALKQGCAVDAFVRLMAPHYATDPQYAAKIMSVIRAHNLTQYDGSK